MTGARFVRTPDHPLVATPLAVRPPAAGEVIVEVAGVSLGAGPALSGRVVDAGEAAAHWRGRRVAVPRVLPCGECDLCRRGRAALCPAAAARTAPATHETVPARYLLPLEPPLASPGTDDALWRLAALPDALGTPYGALARLGVEPGAPLVVLGRGARARAACALAAHLSARVVGWGVAAEQTAASLDEAVAALGGRPGARVVETSGGPAARAAALALLARLPGAALALCDGRDGPDLPGGPPAAFDAEALATGEGLVFGAGPCHPDLLPELAALVVRGVVTLEPLVGDVGLPEAGAAADDYATGRRPTLPILRPGQAGRAEG